MEHRPQKSAEYNLRQALQKLDQERRRLVELSKRDSSLDVDGELSKKALELGLFELKSRAVRESKGYVKAAREYHREHESR